jgi:hypothetical protein
MDGNVLVDGLIEYTPGQIEHKAADYLRRRVDVPTRIPIDVELLLENTRNVTLETCPGLLEEHSVEGCVCNCFMSRDLIVYVDEGIANGLDDARYSAVVAEELAHIELHMALVHQVTAVDDYIEIRQHPKWSRIEQDARLFSDAVRMPSGLLHDLAPRVYSEIIDQHGFCELSVVEKLVRNRMAELFCVHWNDIQKRLGQWPCSNLCNRICISVAARSETLLQDAASSATLVVRQQRSLPE